MHQELIAIKFPLDLVADNTGNITSSNTELFVTDMLVAPSYVIRAFAEFLADRDSEETFFIKGRPVKFEDCSVTVGDSDKVVSAYQCMKRYNMPLGTHKIFAELIAKSSQSAWRLDANYRLFEKWFVNKKPNDDEED